MLITYTHYDASDLHMSAPPRGVYPEPRSLSIPTCWIAQFCGSHGSALVNSIARARCVCSVYRMFIVNGDAARRSEKANEDPRGSV